MPKIKKERKIKNKSSKMPNKIIIYKNKKIKEKKIERLIYLIILILVKKRK